MSDRSATAVVALSTFVAVAVVAMGILLYYRAGQDERAGALPPDVVADAQPRQQATAAGDRAAAGPDEAETLSPLPSFDIVRIGPDGHAVIAGRAAPGAEVTILDGGREIGQVRADRRGEWAFLPEEPLPPGARELTLTARNPDGSESEAETTVALVVPERAGESVLAVTIGPDGGRVLQGGQSSGEAGPLAIGAVSLLSDQRLAISGTAPPGATLHVYIDDRFVGRARAGDDGIWRLEALAPLEPREHVVRVDEVYWEGDVAARVETLFNPAAVAAGPNTVVVSRGDTLWHIAEARYGSGVQYFEIYVANAEQIRDPDLIYPGQVFTLPPVVEQAAPAR